jgi:MoxR-like ATPase
MKLIGMDHKVDMVLSTVERRQPALLYGPTGNGKTMIAWEAAYAYSQKVGLPVVYLQLYPEMTKNSLIGGETIKEGTIVVEEQAIMKMGGVGKGAIFIVDECTHTTEPVLLSFNSLIESPWSTVIGDKVCELDQKTRFIFCGNTPDHAGNIHLPISFANRVFIVSTDLPDNKTLCAIGEEVNKDKVFAESGKAELPKTLIEFFADLIVKTHEPSFPISPRNMVICVTAAKSLTGTGYEAVTKNGPPKTIADACKKAKINADMLKEVILSSMMAHVITKSQGPEKVAALLW